MLAKVTQVDVVDGVPGSRVTDGLDSTFLRASTLRAYEDAEIHHLGRCVSGLERWENLSRGAPAKVDWVSAREAVRSEDLFEDGRVYVCIP